MPGLSRFSATRRVELGILDLEHDAHAPLAQLPCAAVPLVPEGVARLEREGGREDVDVVTIVERIEQRTVVGDRPTPYDLRQRWTVGLHLRNVHQSGQGSRRRPASVKPTPAGSSAPWASPSRWSATMARTASTTARMREAASSPATVRVGGVSGTTIRWSGPSRQPPTSRRPAAGRGEGRHRCGASPRKGRASIRRWSCVSAGTHVSAFVSAKVEASSRERSAVQEAQPSRCSRTSEDGGSVASSAGVG